MFLNFSNFLNQVQFVYDEFHFKIKVYFLRVFSTIVIVKKINKTIRRIQFKYDIFEISFFFGHGKK